MSKSTCMNIFIGDLILLKNTVSIKKIVPRCGSKLMSKMTKCLSLVILPSTLISFTGPLEIKPSQKFSLDWENTFLVKLVYSAGFRACLTSRKMRALLGESELDVFRMDWKISRHEPQRKAIGYNQTKAPERGLSENDEAIQCSN